MRNSILLVLLLALPAQATPQSEAAIAQRDLAGALAQAARLGGAQAQLAAALRQTEARLRDAASRLRSATAASRAADAARIAARRNLAAVLPGLLRLAAAPDLALLVAGAPPSGPGLPLVGVAARALEDQAAALQGQQARADADRAAAAAGLAVLTATRAGQASQAAALDRIVGQARDQVDQAELAGRDAAARVAAAAARARTLPDAIAAMDVAQARAVARAGAEADRADRQHRSAAAQAARLRQAALAKPVGPGPADGLLAAPVAGPVTRAFGAAAEDGPATGITYAAPAGAPVISPCRGRVAFAAPFRSYGQLLIVECGGGYDVVLAGLGTLAARPGHAARAGETLGRMPATASALYVELRADGRPVDPGKYLGK